VHLGHIVLLSTIDLQHERQYRWSISVSTIDEEDAVDGTGTLGP